MWVSFGERQVARLWWRWQLSCAEGRPRCAGLLLPVLSVHAHHEEPEHQRSFREDAEDLNVGQQIVCEWRCQKGQPTQTGKRNQRTQNSRQEGRPENEVADQEQKQSVKYPRVAQRDGLSRELALSLTLTRGHLIGLQPRPRSCKQPDET